MIKKVSTALDFLTREKEVIAFWNANRIFAAATFGLFTNGVETFDNAYEEGVIYRVLTTNLTYQRPELFDREYYVSVDLSKYIALVIDNLNHNNSLSSLLTPTDRINNYLAKHRAEQQERLVQQ